MRGVGGVVLLGFISLLVQAGKRKPGVILEKLAKQYFLYEAHPPLPVQIKNILSQTSV